MPTVVAKKGNYVPIGHDVTNADGRVCFCGSDTHVNRQHSLCPLNRKRWPDQKPIQDRLRLYLHRRVWRYWDYDDGSRQKCLGTVVKIDKNIIVIAYDEGGVDRVTEEKFLTIVEIMRKVNPYPHPNPNAKP